MGIAFFDLDKTLLSVNSATLWIARELRHGHITRYDAARAAFWVTLYGVGVAQMQDVLEQAIASLRGQRERDVILRTLDFWREEVAMMVRPGAYAAVEKHRARGDLVFLLTSSSNYLSAPVSDLFELDGFLANRFAVEDGLFTGKSVGPMCFGPGKVVHGRALAEKLSVPLEECTFYTDSFSDLPMLLAVGHPVAVHPDPRLKRAALKRHWPIEYWNVAPATAAAVAAAEPTVLGS